MILTLTRVMKEDLDNFLENEESTLSKVYKYKKSGKTNREISNLMEIPSNKVILYENALKMLFGKVEFSNSLYMSRNSAVSAIRRGLRSNKFCQDTNEYFTAVSSCFDGNGNPIKELPSKELKESLIPVQQNDSKMNVVVGNGGIGYWSDTWDKTKTK